MPIAVAFAGALVRLMGRLFGIRASAMALLPFAALPAVALHSVAGKQDLMATMFVLSSPLAADVTARSGQRAGALIGGLLFGFALGTKPTVALYAPLVVAWLLVRWNDAATCSAWRQLATLGLIATAGVLVGYAPWLIREAVEYGSPLNTYLAPLRRPVAESSLADTFGRVIRLPWLFTVGGVRNSTTLPWLFWPLLGIGLWKYRRSAGAWYALAGVIYSTIVFTYFGFDRIRFMLAGIALLAGLAGLGLFAIASHDRKLIRWTLGAAAGVGLGIPALARCVVGWSSILVLIGASPPEELAAKWLGGYDVAQWSQENLTWQDRVWSVDFAAVMYMKGRVFFSAGNDIGSDLRRGPSTPEEACSKLRQYEIDYVIAGRGVSAVYDRPGLAFADLVACCLDTAFVAGSDGHVVYRTRLHAQ